MPVQSTLQAVSNALGTPYVITREALLTSNGDAQMANVLLKEPGPGLVCFDIPGFRTPTGNRQDRRLQDRVVSWMRAAYRAGRTVVALGRQGPQWSSAALSQLVGTQPWNLSRHRWHGFGLDARVTTVLLTTVFLANTMCQCGASCSATPIVESASASHKFDMSLQASTFLINAVCEAANLSSDLRRNFPRSRSSHLLLHFPLLLHCLPPLFQLTLACFKKPLKLKPKLPALTSNVV